MFLLYESACMTLPQVECNINHYHLAVEHVILKVGQTAVETTRASFLYSNHLDSTQDDLYDIRALPRLAEIISTLPHMEITY